LFSISCLDIRISKFSFYIKISLRILLRTPSAMLRAVPP